jgi:hypothetical protein
LSTLSTYAANKVTQGWSTHVRRLPCEKVNHTISLNSEFSAKVSGKAGQPRPRFLMTVISFVQRNQISLYLRSLRMV